jgi:DNA uptake protein ComE-like DNA-binding protein
VAIDDTCQAFRGESIKMVDEVISTQTEPRSKTLTAAVSVSEQRDFRLVADTRCLTVSDILRDMTVAEVVAEAARIRQAAEAA